jgi:hypothetical protein
LNKNLRNLLIFLGALGGAAVIYFAVIRLTPSGQSVHPTGDGVTRISPSLVKSTGGERPQTKAPRAAMDTFANSGSAPEIAIAQMAKEQNLALLLNDVRRSSDSLVQEYAVFAPTQLCLQSAILATNGFLPLLEVKRTLMPAAMLQLTKQKDAAILGIAQRCRDYRRDGLLRDSLAKELSDANAPISLATRTISLTAVEKQSADLGVIRGSFDEIFRGENLAIKIQLLRGLIAWWGQRWVEQSVPEIYRPDALLLAGIAVDIAACREGAPCDGDSIARASVCARFGECDSPNVEAAYRRLHVLYEVPFDMTDTLARRYEIAIRNKKADMILAGS